jgi:signal transduction histidine kinase
MPPASDPLADSFDDKDDPYSANSDIWRIEATVAPRDIAFTIHDAKNMLGVISANVAYLAESIELTETGSGAGAALDDLRAATERASALLREALDSLRGSSRRGTAPAGVRVAPVVGASVARSRRSAEALGVRLEMREIHDQRVPIEPDLLERVMDNLLDNALRFSKAGDVVEVTSRVRGSRLLLSVADQGPGIREDDREAIFTSYRTPGPAPAGVGNFGLGLAFCRAVARSSGGDVYVESGTRGGACFVLELG